jgi:hypothetical protein
LKVAVSFDKLKNNCLKQAQVMAACMGAGPAYLCDDFLDGPQAVSKDFDVGKLSVVKQGLVDGDQLGSVVGVVRMESSGVDEDSLTCGSMKYGSSKGGAVWGLRAISVGVIVMAVPRREGQQLRQDMAA